MGTPKFVDSWSEAPVAWNSSSLAGVWGEGSLVGHCALSPGSPLTAGAGVRVALLGPALGLAPQYLASAGPAPPPDLRTAPDPGGLSPRPCRRCGVPGRPPRGGRVSGPT